MSGVDAVIFDWGGTLTRWHDVDFHAESLALAQAVVDAEHDAGGSRARLHAAGEAVWGRAATTSRARRSPTCSPRPGSTHDPELLTAYCEFWEPHTLTDPEVGPLFEALRADGHQGRRAVQHHLAARLARGASSRRDGVLDLIDGDVYTSEIPWTKPSPQAFRAAMDAVGVDRPGALRVRRRPALRRHLGRPERRPAGHPRPAQPHPGRPGRPHARATPTPSCTGWPRSPASSRPGADTARAGSARLCNART